MISFHKKNNVTSAKNSIKQNKTMLNIALGLKTCRGSLLSLTIILPLQNFAVTVESVANPRQAKLNWLMVNLETRNNSEIAVVTVPEIAPASSPKPKADTKKTQSDNSFDPAALFGFLIVVSVALGLLFNRSRRGSHATGSSSFPKNSGDCSDSFSDGSCDGGDAGGDF